MPKTKLTEEQKNEFRKASNRVSLESLRYAADICGYTPLLTETIAALDNLGQRDPISGDFDSGHCRQLYNEAAKLTSREEPMLHAIRIALAWASTDGSGEFMVGNLVDPILYARLNRKEKHSNAEVYQRLEEIHRQCLNPYYQKLKAEREQNA